MKQIILLISLSFLFTSQVMAAAAGIIYRADTPDKTPATTIIAKSFLDTYNPDKITADTFIPNIAPFSGGFLLLGETLYGIKTDLSNLETWQAKLHRIIDRLQVSPYKFEPKYGDEPTAPDPISWVSHTIAPKDFEIAEALFLAAQRLGGVQPTYTEVEFSVWEQLHGILGIPPLHKAKPPEATYIIDSKSLAAMDLWVFLFAAKLRVWPYETTFCRFEEPSEYRVKTSDEIPFLTKIFKGLVTAYVVARGN